MSEQKHSHERKTSWVVIITAITMVAEILFGLSSNSMALLADGIHMGSHVLAIGLSTSKGTYGGNTNKILSLSGYSSGLMLLIFAIVILTEAIQRIFNPSFIHYKEAILVAVVGLLVNITCAYILHPGHEHSDHNIKAAYLHVLADALTSVTAIAGLSVAMIWNIVWFDALAAIISSFVIIRWSVGLLKDSGKVLLDIKTNKNQNHEG
jgi:cation diffusion facilitator family transporter